MGWREAPAFFAIFAALWAGLATAANADAAELIGVRFGPDAAKTRLVIDLNGAPESYEISGESAGNGRLVIDFEGLDVAPRQRASAKGKGHFAEYQFTALGGDRARAVFDLAKTARVKEAFLLTPKNGVKKHRLVIDMTTASKAAFLKSAPERKARPAPYSDLASVIEKATTGTGDADRADKPRPVPSAAVSRKKSAPAPSLAPLATKQIVLIDPGHGGRDPGATGPNGTKEKTITLAAALELEKILKKTGRYHIVLSRRDDTRIRPDAVEALARKVGADLFISLHADAIPNPQVRGASVYTLSKEGTKRSAKAAREQGNYIVNDVDLNTDLDKDVSGMLFNLVQRETNNSSSQFAELLIQKLTGVAPMLNRSHRTGDLRVLLAPDVPAVLLEMAFISNESDEKNLLSAQWRKKTMAATAEAIDEYLRSNHRSQHAAAGAGGAR
ncbi:MAG: N-acetylmuramoyl-L-alanine amidase [Pseudomonadota bacterium]